MPRVSVVIPTRGRPTLLLRAVRSVLAQAMEDWELVVVVDGPDPETLAVLSDIRDPRIRTIVNRESLGGGGARNTGIEAARAIWIALLDDDDEWLPDKLGSQLAVLGAPAPATIGFTGELVRTPHGDYQWSRRAPSDGEHISDYMFTRRGLFAGDGGIHTSTLMAPRDLFMQCPFDPTLRRYQDTDWVLRAASTGAKIVYSPMALTIRYHEQERASIGQAAAAEWPLAIEFVRRRRDLMTRRAIASFLLLAGGSAAASARDLRGALTVLRTAWRLGAPSILGVAVFVAKVLTPAGLRRWLRSRLAR